MIFYMYYKMNASNAKNIIGLQSDTNNHNVCSKFSLQYATQHVLCRHRYTQHVWWGILSSPRLPVRRNEFWQALAAAHLHWSWFKVHWRPLDSGGA